MYDFDELRIATDALWGAIARGLGEEGIAAPAVLERGRALGEVWTDPLLLLAQTCGYPLVTALAGKVAVVATPRYRAAGCEGAWYRSAIIVRANAPAACLADLRGHRCAVNGADSNSGMNMLRAAVAPIAGGTPMFFSEMVVTGGHEASVRAVAGGDADVAAIDCVTWAHLRNLRPHAVRGLRVLGWTEPSPGLPLITSLATGAATRRAVARVLEDVARNEALAAVRAALLLEGFEAVPLPAYDVILAAERRAQALGYPALR